MHTTAPSPFPEPWDPSIVARYLTVAGATVDLTHVRHATRTKCAGCGQHHDHSTRNYYASSSGKPVYFEDRDQGDRAARKWAQTHAEKCRALPRPA